MTAWVAALTPGMFISGMTVIGAVKPGFLVAMILRFMEPFCTSGTFGSTMFTTKGTSSVTAAATLFASIFQYSDCPGAAMMSSAIW
jgi:hypothetical protein